MQYNKYCLFFRSLFIYIIHHILCNAIHFQFSSSRLSRIDAKINVFCINSAKIHQEIFITLGLYHSHRKRKKKKYGFGTVCGIVHHRLFPVHRFDAKGRSIKRKTAPPPFWGKLCRIFCLFAVFIARFFALSSADTSARPPVPSARCARGRRVPPAPAPDRS